MKTKTPIYYQIMTDYDIFDLERQFDLTHLVSNAVEYCLRAKFKEPKTPESYIENLKKARDNLDREILFCTPENEKRFKEDLQNKLKKYE